ncbi:MAG: UDP-N-acetylglucosamine 2-epimerase (non-hydrolyzing) [Bacteroidota bacterium]
MKKVLIIFGTRPEAIKMVSLVKAFETHAPEVECKVCVTAQHREMLDQVLELFDIQPDFDLDIMKANQSLYEVTSRILLGLKEVLSTYKPDHVFVHGDTTTTMASSLAAFYQQIKVCHVEAGLRTGNLMAPYPEEANRKLTGVLTDIHFAPTESARQNLLKEGYQDDAIHVTGNTVIDSLQWVVKKLAEEGLATGVENQLKGLGFEPRKEREMVLITGHRRENFGGGFQNICEAIIQLADHFPEVDFVYPVHLNPNVQGVVYDKLTHHSNIYLLPPLGYLPFVYLMNKSYLVLTDSGGVQEEAPGLGKPVLVMRETTERPEAVSAGTVRLVGTDQEKIFSSVKELLEDAHAYRQMSTAINPYGDGQAATRIVDFYLSRLPIFIA